MKHAFVKVRASSPALRVGDPQFNAERIAEEIARAEEDGTELLVLPELSLSGYTCGDLFLHGELLAGCERALRTVVGATEGKRQLVFVGLPVAIGANLYNCAAALFGGKLLALIPKTCLPGYGEFYEPRHFTAADKETKTVFFCGEHIPFGTRILFRNEQNPAFCVGCEICEDLWAPVSPSLSHAAAGANIIVNLSASNETVGKLDYRRLLVKSQSGKLCCGYVYADAGRGESTSDMAFAGHNLIAENGILLSESLPFSGGRAESEIDAGFLERERRRLTTFRTEEGGYTVLSFSAGNREGELTRKVDPEPFVPQGRELEKRCGLILSIQSSALAKRLEDTKAKTAVVGISGGLDSTLALLVAVRAFDLLQRPREGRLAVSMPGFGTTLRTKNNAMALMQATGVSMRTINIGGSVNRHFKDIGHDPEDRNVTYENAQARMRTMILMDLANETGGLVIGTGDLSELALGWCTYNGDHMSMYAVNCSVPKTLVKSLVAYEGKRLGGRIEAVLRGVLNTEISPELLPPDERGEIAQKTEDLIGPYELHDFYLYSFLRRGDPPAKTFFLAQIAFRDRYDRATLKKWLVNFYRRFFSQQFKRNCVPDGVKIGSVSLSPRADWRMPSDASAALWLEEAENL